VSLIPETFRLLGHSIRVRRIRADEPIDDDGVWLKPRCEIAVATVGSVVSYQEHSFYHELAHAWLDVIDPELSKDERAVDLLGGLIHQFEKTKRGDLLKKDPKEPDART